ncbi:hypothetical protein LZ31DRAFT_32871 [Colletotrichum somersetense]|nr:hypothetical protein LZ31DRAFT_32871 [Colletotrichum somersetense]
MDRYTTYPCTHCTDASVDPHRTTCPYPPGPVRRLGNETSRPGNEWSLVFFGLAWPGMAWPGLDGTGRDWTGLDWTLYSSCHTSYQTTYCTCAQLCSALPCPLCPAGVR